MTFLIVFTCLPVKTSFSTPAESLYYQGLKQKDPLKAVEIYRNVAVKYPDSPQADSSLFRIGMFYYILKDFKQSASTFEMITKKGEKSALYEKAKYWAWKCYSLSGNVSKAKELKEEKKLEKPTGKYTIQVGAFKQKNWAENMYQRLKLLGFDAFIKKSGGLIRVFVGGFETKDEAKPVLEELKKKGFEGYVRTYPE